MTKTVKLISVRDPLAVTNVRIDDVLTLPHRTRVKRFGVGLVAEGDEGRQEFGGPMVPGPWAFSYGLSVCIDNHGGTGAERQRNLAAGTEHDVNEGDIVEIDGHSFVIKVTRNGFEPYIKFVPKA